MLTHRFKLILSVFFLVFGLACAVLTFSLSNKDSYGKIESFGSGRLVSVATGTGVDSSNDGVAIGLGIISGFSFLSFVLLLTSVQSNNRQET